MDVADDELSSDADQDLELIKMADRAEEEVMTDAILNAAVDEAETMETELLPITVAAAAASKPSEPPLEDRVVSNVQLTEGILPAKNDVVAVPAVRSTSVPSPEHIPEDQEDYPDYPDYEGDYYFEREGFAQYANAMYNDERYLSGFREVEAAVTRLTVDGQRKWFRVPNCKFLGVAPRSGSYVYRGCSNEGCEKKIDPITRVCPKCSVVAQPTPFFKVKALLADRNRVVLEMYVPDVQLQKMAPDLEPHQFEALSAAEQKTRLDRALQTDRTFTVLVKALKSGRFPVSYTAQEIEFAQVREPPVHRPDAPNKDDQKPPSQPRAAAVNDLPKSSSQSRVRSPAKASTSAVKINSPKAASVQKAPGIKSRKRSDAGSKPRTSAKDSVRASAKGVQTRSSKRKDPPSDIEDDADESYDEEEVATDSDDGMDDSSDEDEKSSVSLEDRDSMEDFIDDDEIDPEEERERSKKKKKSRDGRSKYRSGTPVFAKWHGDSSYYFGRVRSSKMLSSGKISVEWDDGDKAEVKESNVIGLEDIVVPHCKATFIGLKYDMEEYGEIVTIEGTGKDMTIDLRIPRIPTYPAKVLEEIPLGQIRFLRKEVQDAHRFRSYQKSKKRR